MEVQSRMEEWNGSAIQSEGIKWKCSLEWRSESGIDWPLWASVELTFIACYTVHHAPTIEELETG